MTVEVTRTYLQMLSPDEHVRASETPLANVAQVKNCPASFYRYLYTEVGRRYVWVDRLSWSDPQILEYLAQPSVTFCVLYVEGSPAGYYELKKEPDGSVEITFFGLMQEYIGKGFGKAFLSDAIDRAWSQGAKRVWLHTCTLDDPAAMPNYKKRGFQPFKTETFLSEGA